MSGKFIKSLYGFVYSLGLSVWKWIWFWNFTNIKFQRYSWNIFSKSIDEDRFIVWDLKKWLGYYLDWEKIGKFYFASPDSRKSVESSSSSFADIFYMSDFYNTTPSIPEKGKLPSSFDKIVVDDSWNRKKILSWMKKRIKEDYKIKK